MSSMKKATKTTRKNGLAHSMPRAHRPAKSAKRRVTQEIQRYATARQTFMLGAAAAALGLAAGAGVFGRRSIARLVRSGLENANSATRSFGNSARRAGHGIGQELEISRLLAHLGLPRRRSLLRRIAAPLGLLGGLVAATATTVLLLRSRTPAEGTPVGNEPDSQERDEKGVARDFIPSGNAVHAHQ
jgi:hypothetical protein